MKHLLSLHDLRKVNLQNTKVTWRGIAEIAARLTQVTSLAVGGEGTDPAELGVLSGMAQLEELDLGGVKTTDEEILHLRSLRSLRTLRLSDWCGDKGLEALRTLSNMETLVLYDSHVTDGGLSSLESMKRLTSLDLRWSSAITDAGIGAIGRCKSLRSLRLTGTGVSPAGVARLRKLLPGCQIEYVEKKA